MLREKLKLLIVHAPIGEILVQGPEFFKLEIILLYAGFSSGLTYLDLMLCLFPIFNQFSLQF